MQTQASIERTICLCNTHGVWGGGEQWQLEAAKALVMRGWHVTLLANPACRLYDEAQRFAESLSNTEVAEGTKLGFLCLVPLKITSLSFLNPCTMARLVRLFRREKVQRLIVGLPAELKSVALAAKIAGVPQIIYRRGSALPVRNSGLNRYLYGSVLTSLIVNSTQTRTLVLAANEHLIAHDRIHLLPNGLDVETFDASLAQASLPNQKELLGHTPESQPEGQYEEENGSQLVIGNAGRLDTQKGQHYLVRMMPHLLQNKPDGVSDIRLVIAGDGALREELEALAHALGVREHVHFTGFMSDLGPFWKSIDIFVLSSLWEGFGYVLVEAMAAKVPVVAFAVSSIPELVDHGYNGLLVRGPNEAVGMHDAMGGHNSEDEPECRLAETVLTLAKDANKRQTMGEHGRNYVLANYTQNASMNHLEQILLR